MQGYEDDLSSLEDALKNSVKYMDRQHLCRAIWRSKRTRCQHEKSARKDGHLQASPKSKHLHCERVFRCSDVPKAPSDFHSTVFEFPNTVTGQKLRQAEDDGLQKKKNDRSKTG